MLRKQGLASAAALLPDLPERSTDPGHIQALRRNGRSFTLADQVNQTCLGPAKRTADLGALWRERWRCVPCREATPATVTSTSESTALTSSDLDGRTGGNTSSPTVPTRA